MWTWLPCAPCTPMGLSAFPFLAWKTTMPKPGTYHCNWLSLSVSLSLTHTCKHTHLHTHKLSLQGLHNSHLNNLLSSNLLAAICLSASAVPCVRFNGLLSTIRNSIRRQCWKGCGKERAFLWKQVSLEGFRFAYITFLATGTILYSLLSIFLFLI